MRLAAAVGMVLLCGAVGTSAQVRVWEGSLKLAASDEGPGDPTPAFGASKFGPVYPYAMRDDLLVTESAHAWRAVFLENEYLKCSILPDLGGHIYTCVDKINGVPMFYANPTLKKALISYRGAWAAFGDEFNFPVSHNWVTLSPVDFAMGTASDGSAWVTVGSTDRVEGMRWTVEMVLRPGSTVLEEHVTLSNPGNARQRYYWWNNGGVEVWSDSRIWYPMDHTIEDGKVAEWPERSWKGDMSVVGNQVKGAFARFAYGTLESYMGVYNPHTDAGIVHYADHKEVPGMKIWTWGANAEGLGWRKALSDNDSAYAEMQGGLFQDQDTYRFLDPQKTVRFAEYWMPVRGLGAISRANLNGVVAMRREAQADGSSALKVALNVNRAVAGARVEILAGEESVFAETAALEPAKTWVHLLEKSDAGKTYRFVVKDAQGVVLLEHTEGKYDFAAVTPEKAVGDAVVAHGLELEAHGKDAEAWQAFAEGVKKFPGDAELLQAAGRIGVRMFRYTEAAEFLGEAVKLKAASGEAHYYLGLAYEGLHREEDAKRELKAAEGSAGFWTSAALLLAETEARHGAAADAVKRMDAVCGGMEGDSRCVEERVALKRVAGDADGAKALVVEGLGEFPTSAFLQEEAVKLGMADSATGTKLEAHLEAHLGADSQRVLNLVVEYDRLGLWKDSVELLTRSYPRAAADAMDAGALAPEDDALLVYYRGFCREKLGQSGQADYASAGTMPLKYVFPSREDTVAVLQAALASRPSDASAHYLLGLLWYSRSRGDEAMAEWKRAEALNANLPGLYATIGRADLDRNDAGAAAGAFEQGMKVEPASAALYLGLNEAMRLKKASPAARVKMLQRYPTPGTMPGTMVDAMVDALREAGRYGDADALLARRYVAAREGKALPVR